MHSLQRQANPLMTMATFPTTNISGSPLVCSSFSVCSGLLTLCTAAFVGLALLLGCCGVYCDACCATRVPWEAPDTNVEGHPGTPPGQMQEQVGMAPAPPLQAHMKIEVVGVTNEWEPSPPPPPPLPYYPVSPPFFVCFEQLQINCSCPPVMGLVCFT